MIQRIKILLLAILIFYTPCTTAYAATQPVDAEGHTAEDLENKQVDIIAGSTNAVIYWQDNKIWAVYYSGKDIYYDDSSNVMQGGRQITYKGGQGNGSQGDVKITDIYKIKGQVTIQDKFTNEIKGTLTQADVKTRIEKEDMPKETTPANGQQTNPNNNNTGILSGVTDIVNAVTNIPSKISKFIEDATNTITSAIDDLQTSTKAIPDKISGFIAAATDRITNILTGIKDTIVSIITGIADAINNIKDQLLALVDSLLTGLKDLLQQAFVPTPEQMAEIVPNPDDYNFVKPQIQDLQDQLGATSDEAPKLTITVPGNVKQLPQELTILDCAALDPYKDTIHKTISAFMQISFIQGIICNVPNIISGSGLINTNDNKEVA